MSDVRRGFVALLWQRYLAILPPTCETLTLVSASRQDTRCFYFSKKNISASERKRKNGGEAYKDLLPNQLSILRVSLVLGLACYLFFYKNKNCSIPPVSIKKMWWNTQEQIDCPKKSTEGESSLYIPWSEQTTKQESIVVVVKCNYFKLSAGTKMLEALKLANICLFWALYTHIMVIFPLLFPGNMHGM